MQTSQSLQPNQEFEAEYTLEVVQLLYQSLNHGLRATPRSAKPDSRRWSAKHTPHRWASSDFMKEILGGGASSFVKIPSHFCFDIYRMKTFCVLLVIIQSCLSN